MRTPYYSFNKSQFINAIAQYKQFGEVYYPIKANDSSFVVQSVIDTDCSFEVDSIEHIKQLICKYNVEPQKLIFSFPAKRVCDIRLAQKLGVKKFVVDSFAEYEKIRQIVNGAEYILRLNVNTILHEMEVAQDKWGLSSGEVHELRAKIISDDECFLGVSFYLNAEINSVHNFRKVFNCLLSMHLGQIKVLDIGGGISVEMLTELSSDLCTLKSALQYDCLIIEPGRLLLDPCIDMVVEVVAIKHTCDGQKVLIIDSSIYGGLIDVVIKRKRFNIEEARARGGETENYYVCGFSSDVSDFIGEYSLSKSIAVGDRLIIKNCGAYSSVMTTKFYARKSPRTIVS